MRPWHLLVRIARTVGTRPSGTRRRYHAIPHAVNAAADGLHAADQVRLPGGVGASALTQETGDCGRAGGLARNAELEVRVREMPLDRAHAQREACGDLLVAEAVGGEVEHFALASRERGDVRIGLRWSQPAIRLHERR